MKKVKKKTKKKTVAQILDKCSLNDELSDGTRTWKVSEAGDDLIIAMPTEFPKGESPFELWNCGVESLAIIPHLKKV